MFTGIVTDMGSVRGISGADERRLRLACGYDMQGVAIGASIACAGVCLTVVARGEDWFDADVSAETLSKTTLGAWSVGRRINLERALRIGDELGGHVVSGHVDGVAEVVSTMPEGDSHRLVLRAPAALSSFIAPKGSVTLDGVSLTVNAVDGDRFGVNIIPHTRAVTTLGALRAGDRVNLEIDVLARYVARLAEAGTANKRTDRMSDPQDKRTILIVTAPFYRHITALMLEGARGVLTDAGHAVETIEVPGALEIPPAIAIAAGTGRYDGYVALGCVLRGETTHYETVCNESARGLMDLGVSRGLAIGNGILTVETEAQALDRADPARKNKGAGAAEACLALLALPERLGAPARTETFLPRDREIQIAGNDTRST